MKKAYSSSMVDVYNCDFREVIKELSPDCLVISDPPYNIGFGAYDIYKDNLPDADYIGMLAELRYFKRVVLIDYPEETARYIIPALGPAQHYSTWCYNANSPRRFRMVSWYGLKPDYSRIKIPYKNLNDKRTQMLIERGSEGSNLYEWWDDIQLVMNVSQEKGNHPCPIPEKLAKRIIILSENSGGGGGRSKSF